MLPSVWSLVVFHFSQNKATLHASKKEEIKKRPQNGEELWGTDPHVKSVMPPSADLPMQDQSYGDPGD